MAYSAFVCACLLAQAGLACLARRSFAAFTVAAAVFCSLDLGCVEKVICACLAGGISLLGPRRSPIP